MLLKGSLKSGLKFSSCLSRLPKRSLATDQAEDDAPKTYLNPDWFRTPQKSDGPGCIAPDYPKVPYESCQLRPPSSQWVDGQLRRSLGEPLNENYDVLSSQNFDIESTYSIRYMLTGVGVAAASLFGIMQLFNMMDDQEGWRKVAVDRELPYMSKYQIWLDKEHK